VNERSKLREAVMRHWDPIGVFDEDDDDDTRADYWDEYDAYLPTIAERLASGKATDVSLADYLESVRTSFMGMHRHREADLASARALLDWYSSRPR
jgi:hypothetical protein